MPKVIADITMSLDGYVTGPGADEQHGLGDAPELHTWVTEQDAVDTEILERATAQSGAVVMGRRLFDTVETTLHAVSVDPNHPFHDRFNTLMYEFVERLQPELRPGVLEPYRAPAASANFLVGISTSSTRP